eukprot:4559357-Amphidinium_carterae.1
MKLAKRVILRVASGKPCRALMYQNMIHASTVYRPLISVGQLRDYLGLRFVWEDETPQLHLLDHGT